MPKSVLITGCSPGGIGHSLAREFKSKGWRVFATARKADTITDLAALGIETLSLEVTEEKSIQALHDEIASRTNSSLDILLNNAGRNYTVPAVHVDMEEIRLTFETNVFAVMRMCQIFMPFLINAKGAIVQIGSVAGVVPYVFGSVYNSTKAALHSYSNTLRVELAPFDVRVITIVTGGVRSNIARTERQLPRDSIYLPIEDDYNKRLTHSQASGIRNEQYAASVVSQLLASPNKDTIWEGGKSWLVWFASSYFPRWIQDEWMTRNFQLGKLRGTVTKKLQ